MNQLQVRITGHSEVITPRFKICVRGICVCVCGGGGGGGGGGGCVRACVRACEFVVLIVLFSVW